MAAYRKNFDEAKFMYFLIKDAELLENYNEIQEKASQPVYNKKYLI